MNAITTTPSQSVRTRGLRIGLFTESFAPVQNGVTTSVQTLIAELRAQGHHVWVFAPEHRGQTEPETHVVRFPSFVSHFNPEYPLAYPFLPGLTLTAHIEKLKLDIIHTHTPFVMGMTGADAAIRHGIPLITTFHTLYSHYSHYVRFIPESFTQRVLEAFLPWYYNRCAAILCPSHIAADYLKELGVSQSIDLVPTGIPLPPENSTGPEARRRIRELLELDAETPLALYAGRLAPEKNIDWLLETFAEVQQRNPSAVLAIAGGGPMLNALQAIAAEKLPPKSVRFLGPVGHSDMPAYYTAADVFCFPSPSETQGLVIGEAQAAGTPCVVIDAGGAPEVVNEGEDGYRVPLNDRAQFADRVERILRDKALRRRLSENALANAARHTPAHMVYRIVEIYERAMNEGGNGRSGAYSTGIAGEPALPTTPTR